MTGVALCSCGHLESLHDHQGLCWRDHECHCRGFNASGLLGELPGPSVGRAKNPNARQRWRMWRRDPRCYYCGCNTRFIHRGGQDQVGADGFFDDEATIEHLHSRLNPERGMHSGNFTKVIACRKCNSERNDIEQRTLGAAEARRRAELFRARFTSAPRTDSTLMEA